MGDRMTDIHWERSGENWYLMTNSFHNLARMTPFGNATIFTYYCNQRNVYPYIRINYDDFDYGVNDIEEIVAEMLEES